MRFEVSRLSNNYYVYNVINFYRHFIVRVEFALQDRKIAKQREQQGRNKGG